MIKFTAKQDQQITQAVKALNDVLDEIQKANPKNDINWYLEDSNSLCLMSDSSHDEKGKARQDRVVEHYYLNQSSGGGF